MRFGPDTDPRGLHKAPEDDAKAPGAALVVKALEYTLLLAHLACIEPLAPSDTVAASLAALQKTTRIEADPVFLDVILHYRAVARSFAARFPDHWDANISSYASR